MLGTALGREKYQVIFKPLRTTLGKEKKYSKRCVLRKYPKSSTYKLCGNIQVTVPL